MNEADRRDIVSEAAKRDLDSLFAAMISEARIQTAPYGPGYEPQDRIWPPADIPAAYKYRVS